MNLFRLLPGKGIEQFLGHSFGAITATQEHALKQIPEKKIVYQHRAALTKTIREWKQQGVYIF